VLTPHAAFFSRESLVEMKRRVCEKMVAALGTPSPRQRNAARG
jgi:lactate dehydrogenase-like 2-hydroxyacid dehydrogenase